MKDSHIEILHDHYKESFSDIREREKRRNKLFFTLIIFLGLLFLVIQYPAHIQNTITEFSFGGANFDLRALPLFIIVSILWTIFTLLVMNYCKIAINIERKYNYLHKLEEKLSTSLQDENIYIREGKAYLENYPIFSEWVWIFYTYLFPLIIIGLSVYLIYIEYAKKSLLAFNSIYDSLIAFSAILSFMLYKFIPLFKKKKDNN